ncbi:MAG: hypothetical protein E6Q97_10835 [Desulfurellales bacterium]|nr:MAG: hypothetical protein E6Q97_10835 [Desulfurellales bacterium]
MALNEHQQNALSKAAAYINSLGNNLTGAKLYAWWQAAGLSDAKLIALVLEVLDQLLQAGEEEAKRNAELALLKHLALEGELTLHRDQLADEHQAVSQRLALAREQRQGLVKVVKDAGGDLPSWEV